MIANTVTKANNLCELLRERLKSFSAGEQFLTIREIMRQYQVSQSVVDRAVARLRAEHLLSVESSRNGLTVSDPAQIQVQTVAEPEILLVMPHWNSHELQELDQKHAEINKRGGIPRIRVELFEPNTPVPRGLERKLSQAGGMILMPPSGIFGREDLETFCRYCDLCPTVVFGHHYSGTGAGSVGLDDVAASCIAIQHVRKHGHKRIGILISEPLDSVIRERVRTLESYAAIHGMQVDVIDCGILPGEIPATKTYDTFYQVIRDGFEFTALIGISGESLLGAVNACSNCGIAIPRDLSVVAIAGEDLTRMFSPPIDTVPCDAAGQLEDAVDLLLKIKAGKFKPPMPDLFRITGLLERGSVVRNQRDNRQID